VTAQDAPADSGPAPTTVQPDLDANNFKVDHPDQFPLATAGEHTAAPELNATGVVSPDVSLQVPVPSLATGRIVEIDARLGDEVKKGQLLFKVRSPDVAGAFSNYRQAVKNEELTKVQLNRANILFENGAIPKSSQEVAQNAEDDNVVALETAKEQLGLMGLDPNTPTGTVEVFAPVSGTITDQEITNQSGVQALTPPNPFTISDMSHVWIICDVWENNMSQIHIGEYADIHLVAYPDRALKARISNILPIIDPNIRTAKVPGSGEPRTDAAWNVRDRDVPRRGAGKARDGTGHRDSAFARPRVGLCAIRKWPLPPPGSDGRGHVAR
jgi:cobalt-zinc-cadmium efflux system membrane fusion protein